MKQALKNWSLPIKPSLSTKIQGALLCLLYFSFLSSPAQVANYVNNGGFEDCKNCQNWNNMPLKARYWDAIDTTDTKSNYLFFSELPPSQQVPQIGYAWQWPKSGHSYIGCGIFYPNLMPSKRSYARNTLKQTLEAGKTYCIKFYCNITNFSSYGVDALGAYFGDSSLDTITQCDRPITYLTPQVQNPTGTLLTDTLNWTLIAGTFTANGTEKYMLLGNFRSDAATNSVMINPSVLPTIATDILYDDVSCIDLDLPADAGYDYYLVAGDSAFIGRPPDVGINEACTWYQLPNLATPIATIAGMYVKPPGTTTYVVRQEICGLVKWDTVIVFQSAVGMEALKELDKYLTVYPVPASEMLHVQWPSEVLEKEFEKVEILNALGQVCRTQNLLYENRKAQLSVKELPAGIYTLRLKSVTSYQLSRRVVVER